MDIDYDKLADAIRKGGSGSGLSGDTIAELREQLAKYTKELKASSSPLQKWGKFLNGQTTEMVDMHKVMKDFERQIEETVEQEKKLLKQGKDKEAQQQREMRDELERGKETAKGAVHYKNAQIAAGNAAVGLRNLTSQMVDATFDFVSGLQAGKSGTELLGEAAKNAAKMQSELAKTSGEAMGAFGNMIALLGFFSPAGKIGTILKWVGTAIAFIGETLKIMGPKLSETAVKVIDAFNVEMKNTKEAFKKMTSTGMTLAGGMTEMRNSAVKAGLDVNQFGDFVKNNTETLSHMGVGITQSTKHLLDFNKKMIQGKIGERLYKLGYDFKEQGDLLAFTNAQLIASGKTQLEIDKELLETTEAYGKSLRVLSDMTGKDAKKAMQKAAEEALDMSTFATVFKQAKGKGVNKLGGALVDMSDGLKKTFRQYMSSEGKGITDPAANMYDKATGGSLTAYFKGLRDDILDDKVDDKGYSNEALKKQGTFNEQLRSPQALEFFKKVGPGATLGKNPNQTLVDLLSIATGVNIKTTAIGSKKAVEDSIKNTKAAAETTDALTTSTYKADETVQELASKFTELTTGPLTGFASKLSDGSEALKNFKERLEELGIIDKKEDGGTTEEKRVKANAEALEKAKKISPEAAAAQEARNALSDKFAKRNRNKSKVQGESAPEPFKSTGLINAPKGGNFEGTSSSVMADFSRMNATDPSNPDGKVESNIVDLMRAIAGKYPGSTFIAGAGKHAGGGHLKGRALDWTLPLGMLNQYDKLTDPDSPLDNEHGGLETAQKKANKWAWRTSKSQGNAILDWQKKLGFTKSINEYNSPSSGATGGHFHAEFDAGGVIGPTSQGIVGERGNMELVSGGSRITGSYDTHKLFTSMDKKLSDLVKLMEKQTHTSVKTLRAMS